MINAYPIKQTENFSYKIKEFKNREKAVGFWRDFCVNLPSHVSSELCLLHREVIEEDAFTQRERESIEKKLKKTKKVTEKNNKQLSRLLNVDLVF